MIKKLALGIAVCSWISGVIVENVDGMMVERNCCGILGDECNLKTGQTKESPFWQITMKKINNAQKRLSEPTLETRAKLGEYADFFSWDDKYPIPSRLWNWSVKNDKNMRRALEIGKAIRSALLPVEYADEFEIFDDDIVEAFVNYFNNNKYLLPLDCIYVGMRNLYRIADAILIDEELSGEARRLYDLMYSIMLDFVSIEV